jgi:hypothetical protein
MIESTWEVSGGESTLENSVYCNQGSPVQGNIHAASAHQRIAIPQHRASALQVRLSPLPGNSFDKQGLASGHGLSRS